MKHFKESLTPLLVCPSYSGNKHRGCCAFLPVSIQSSFEPDAVLCYSQQKQLLKL